MSSLGLGFSTRTRWLRPLDRRVNNRVARFHAEPRSLLETTPDSASTRTSPLEQYRAAPPLRQLRSNSSGRLVAAMQKRWTHATGALR